MSGESDETTPPDVSGDAAPELAAPAESVGYVAVKEPRCHCGKDRPGRCTARPTPEPSRLAILTLHGEEACPEQKVVLAWWKEFHAQFIRPLEDGYHGANRTLAAIVGQLPGKRVRVHWTTALEAAAKTGYRVDCEPENGGFMDFHAPDAAPVEESRIAIATHMPPLPPMPRGPRSIR